MAKVFISHSWDDNAISRRLAEYLRRDGAEVWIDYARIEGGDSLPKVISAAIDWCDILILIWSKSAVDSFWVEEEWTCAFSLKKRIIPCLIDTAALPSLLRSKFYIEFSDFEQGYRYLARSLKLVIEQPKIIQEIQTPVTAPKKTLSPLFRSKPQDLDENEVKKMLKKYDFFCKEHVWTKEFCNPSGKGFENDFVLQKNGLVVYDRKSGLMWQQSGSKNDMNYEAAEQYIAELNRDRFAGLDGWRLPTLEEAMSLMEPEKNKDGLYINPMFDKTQWWIWTSDPYQSAARAAWVVYFGGGYCSNDDWFDGYYVRAVRPGQSSLGGEIKK